jgi:hypothetical protein
MVYRTFWFYILDKERLGESRDISQNRTLLDISKHPTVGKTRCGYILTKVEEIEMVNQSLRNRDKVKDDAIAQLSDQIMALSTRLQELERKQQLT